ncbi:unnamed protein product [Euphydryas editha]|uniref:HTH psq-type domain-containing protein n=1 Tax=Euphydryas editha TaxID=104508 RepID=A0AAU9TKY0_EUPED|nr:unnamed protein product [Euphydryas editha]
MPRNYKPDPRGKRYRKYDSNITKQALEEYKTTPNCSFAYVAEKYNINKSVLYRHSRKRPEQYVTRFLKRYNDSISFRMCQNIKKLRAQVSPDTITKLFVQLEESLKDLDPKNIANYDETNLSDDPGRKKIIAKRGTKYPERVLNQSKSSISLMMAGTAAGELLPPYVIYKANNIYDSWITGGPKENVELNLKVGFQKAWLVPVGCDQVLSRLPNYDNEDPDKSRYAVDKSVLEILKEMKYGTTNIKEPARKRKLNARSGKSLGSMLDDDNKQSETEHEITDKIVNHVNKAARKRRYKLFLEKQLISIQKTSYRTTKKLLENDADILRDLANDRV